MEYRLSFSHISNNEKRSVIREAMKNCEDSQALEGALYMLWLHGAVDIEPNKEYYEV